MDAKLKRVFERGQIFAFLENPNIPDKTVRLYQFKESRGYSTGYTAKAFYYWVTITGIMPTSCLPISKDPRRKDFKERCEKQGTKVIITNAEIFAQWTKN